MKTISEIEENIADIQAHQIHEIVQIILLEFDSKIREYANKLLNDTSSTSISYIKQLVQDNFTTAAETYIFKKKHWEKRKNSFVSYLNKCFYSLVGNLKNQLGGRYFVIKQNCPACRCDNTFSFLKRENNLLLCDVCRYKIIDLSVSLNSTTDEKNKFSLEKLINFYQIFSVHSLDGVRCPTCRHWIPKSAINGKCIQCPYPTCTFFGSLDEFPSGSHPVAPFLKEILLPDDISSGEGLSANDKLSYLDYNSSINNPDRFNFSSNILQDKLCIIKNKIEEDLSVLKAIISKHKKKQQKLNFIPRLLMIKAFEQMLDENPFAMTKYLVHGKSGEISIQSAIFQKYVSLVENTLPFNFVNRNKKYSITDLLDPRFSLFLGISSFDADVDEKLIIHNQTKEQYIGSRKLNNYGPCFIGRLIDVKNSSNKSVLKYIKYYTFANIHFTEGVRVGERLTVEHFRIASHYDMDHMSYLQWVRKIITNDIKKLKIGIK